MKTPQKATALVLVGAVGLASAAYGIGSQTGGGSATAGSGSDPGERGFELRFEPGFDALADALGVDADELEQAMRDFHEQEGGDMRSAFATALADALGISVDRVNEALDQMKERHRARFAEQLANELGVETARVEAALEQLSDDKPLGPGEFAEALAGELGVSAEKVADALFSLRPGPDPGPGPGPAPDARQHVRHHAMPLRQLASALDVTRAELRRALTQVRAGAESRWEQREADLAAFLADRFGVSPEKVEEALAELPHPDCGRGPGIAGGHGGPRGPGGPPGPGFGPLP
jgi:CRP-like cAMP-binding protein